MANVRNIQTEERRDWPHSSGVKTKGLVQILPHSSIDICRLPWYGRQHVAHWHAPRRPTHPATQVVYHIRSYWSLGWLRLHSWGRFTSFVSGMPHHRSDPFWRKGWDIRLSDRTAHRTLGQILRTFQASWWSLVLSFRNRTIALPSFAVTAVT